MKPKHAQALLLFCAAAFAAPATAQVTFYEQDNFRGQSFTIDDTVPDFGRHGFNNRASSAVVVGETREVCVESGFRGDCVVLRPGRYASFAEMGLNNRVSSVRPVRDGSDFADGRRGAPATEGKATFYERTDFGGRSFTIDREEPSFARFGFNDRAGSAVVTGAPLEVCDDARFGGRCVVLRPGRYPSLGLYGLNDRVSSARPVAAASVPAGQISLFEGVNFQGHSLVAVAPVENLGAFGFNDRASSAIVEGAVREICDDVGFRGRCVQLRPGRYPSLAAMGLENRISSVRAADFRPAPQVPVAGQVIFYERPQFEGRSFTTDRPVANFERFGFNDRASSAVVIGDAVELCDEVQYAGNCVALRAGRYPSLAAMGLNNRISSVRPVSAASVAASQISLFEGANFQGRSFVAVAPVENLGGHGFNDRASSAIVEGAAREICDDVGFRGRCVLLRPGRYPSLAAMGLENRISSVRAAESRPAPPVPVAGQVIFYERPQFEGRSFTTDRPVANFERFGFNDRASSAVVSGDAAELCDDVQFSGNCVLLRPGRYPSLAAMGMNNRISSGRPVSAAHPDAAPAGPPVPHGGYDGRRRPDERLYEAQVTSVRAVMGRPEQRCWVEAEQVEQPSRGGTNTAGAIAGAVLGGVLGHQVGGGSGKDLATVGGAIAGAILGSRVGRDGGESATAPTQRCEQVAAAGPPAYWDVSYSFRGVEHRAQMSARPGATVLVNERGEPRT